MALALMILGAALVIAAGAMIAPELGLAVAGAISLAAGVDLSRPRARGDQA